MDPLYNELTVGPFPQILHAITRMTEQTNERMNVQTQTSEGANERKNDLMNEPIDRMITNSQ